MSLYDLLPPNATQLERDFSRVTSSLERASRPVPTIRTAKRVNIPDSVVPWLIYEYGLQELLPYLKDPRRAIEEGVLWQRIRGTKAALEQALDWIEYPATIEESESQTLRWAEFQLALDAHPDSFDAIDDVVAVSKLSAPARSRNFRIYNGYDERRFRLDHHVLGEGLLCDHSGVIVREDWPQLSFGRWRDTTKSFTEDFVADATENKILAFEGIYEDKFLLSHSLVDEWWHLLDTGISTGARLHFREYPALEIDCQIYPPLKYAWTGIYLSDDGWYLEDTHAAFSHRVEVETGSVMRLSEADPETKDGGLSEQVFRTEFRELTKRLERDHFAEAAVGEGRGGFLAHHIRSHGVEAIYEDRFLLDAGILDEQWHLIDRLSRDVQHTYVDTYLGFREDVTWADAGTWDDVSWAEGTHLSISTDEKAGIYLSEENKFGGTLFRFHPELLVESYPGALVLDGAEPLEQGQSIELELTPEQQMQPFLLSEGDQLTGLGILGGHLGIDSIAALPSDPEWVALGWNRLSQHPISIVGLGYPEVFDHLFFATAELDTSTIGIDGAPTAIGRITQRQHYFWLEYEDNFLLDAGHLDEGWHLQDFVSRDVQHTRTTTIYAADAFNAQSISLFTSYERAAITLDEEFVFGETNARFPVELVEESFPGALLLSEAEPVEQELDLFVPTVGEMEQFLLSEADPETGWGILGAHVGPEAIETLVTEEFLAVGYHRLSQHRLSMVSLGRTEVFDRIFQIEAGDDRQVTVEITRSSLHVTASVYEDSFVLDASHLDEDWHLIDTAILSSDRTRTWRYFGFDDVTWGYDGLGWSAAFTWEQLQKQQISFFTSFEKAAIYLDESTLGDTNARFSVQHHEETEPGAFVLSEAEPVENEQQLTPLPTEQMEAFLLSEGDPITGFGLLSEHRGPEEIAAAQASVEFQLAGANRLSQHVHRFLPVGFNEVFDRTPYQEEAPLDDRRYDSDELYSNTQEHYFWATDDRRTVEITSRTAERYVDTLDERRSIPEASRTREYQKWATEDPDGIDITSRTAERYWLTLDETRYADAEITSRTAERYRITLDDRQDLTEASRTREYQKWTTEDADSISEASRTAERYWLTLDEARYLEAEAYSNTAERYVVTVDSRQVISEASRTRTYDKWATDQRQLIAEASRTAERYDTADIHGAIRFWTSPGFGWDQIPWAGAFTQRLMDETTEDLVYSTASWSDISRTADHTEAVTDDNSTIEERAGQVVIARMPVDSNSTIEESAGEITSSDLVADDNSTIEEAAAASTVTTQATDTRGAIDESAAEIVLTAAISDDNSTVEEAAGLSVITQTVSDERGEVAESAGQISAAQAVTDDNSTITEDAIEFVLARDTISEVLFFGWSVTWSSTIAWNPSVNMIDSGHESHD